MMKKIKFIVTALGSIVFAFLGGYFGLNAGGTPGAIAFSILMFFFGLVCIPFWVEEFKEKPVKICTQIFGIAIVWILGNYLTRKYL